MFVYIIIYIAYNIIYKICIKKFTYEHLIAVAKSARHMELEYKDR